MTHALLYPRRTCQPVRRDSFDINDNRAQVFRPIEHGIQFVDAYVETLEEWDNLIKRKGERHQLGGNCRKVLVTIMRRCLDFKEGTCEPSLDKLAEMTKLAKPTVVRALRILWQHGFIDWIRRSERTGNRPGEGPQVRQITNAYFFDAKRLPERCYKRLQEKLRRIGKVFRPPEYPEKRFLSLRQRRSFATADRRTAFVNASPIEKARLMHPGDEAAQREYLEMLAGSKRVGASSTTVLNPSFSTKRE